MTITDAKTSKPLRTWNIAWPEGPAALVNGHEIWVDTQSGTATITHYDATGRGRPAMVINLSQVRYIEDITESASS